MTPKVFYQELLSTIGFRNKHSGKSLYHIIDSIAYFLNSARGKNLIVFDEAGKFSPRELLYIHDLRDSTLQSTGYILTGPPYFERDVLKNVKNELKGIPEFHRRINNWIELGLPSYNEKLALCKHYGIIDSRLVQSLCKSVEFETLSLLYDAIFNFGLLVLRELGNDNN
ncbi:ATP-binding protein [Pedobacter roseus]|uniref:ATP-binding protein n=1 Tax=Pedobacter roseus TaxID=336820 RepID=A0A7G9QMA1_9SPHI|nr:ATP-binding protein [Pedobacter roseus]QNN44476.1 ATP-binding protein [Pedobacter roseus]